MRFGHSQTHSGCRGRRILALSKFRRDAVWHSAVVAKYELCHLHNFVSKPVSKQDVNLKKQWSYNFVPRSSELERKLRNIKLFNTMLPLLTSRKTVIGPKYIESQISNIKARKAVRNIYLVGRAGIRENILASEYYHFV